MSIVSVYKCDRTGKLFEDKSKYKSHLAKLTRERRVRRAIEIKNEEIQAWWDQAHQTEMSIGDLQQFIIDNQMRFWADASKADSWHWKHIGKTKRKGVVMPIPELVEFTKFNMRWSDQVSNSHSAPFNGVTNWSGRDEGKPTGYPGWTGRIEWSIKWPKEFDGFYVGSDLFSGSHTGIHTGTGGGGGFQDGLQRFGYHVTIFADDWPGLKRYHEKIKVWNILSDGVDEEELIW